MSRFGPGRCQPREGYSAPLCARCGCGPSCWRANCVPGPCVLRGDVAGVCRGALGCRCGFAFATRRLIARTGTFGDLGATGSFGRIVASLRQIGPMSLTQCIVAVRLRQRGEHGLEPPQRADIPVAGGPLGEPQDGRRLNVAQLLEVA